MAYNIYTTQGLVLSWRPLREADRVYSILTKDLGLIRATATGVRKGESKLRASLEPLSLSSISLVRGKEYWRVTSAKLETSLSVELKSKKKIFKSLSKVLALLAGLVQGEEAHPELFEALLPIINSAAIQDEEEREEFEIKLVSQTLFHLGYLSEKDLHADKKSLIKAINEGLEASNLNKRK